MAKTLTLCLLMLTLAACNLTQTSDSHSGTGQIADLAGTMIVAWVEEGNLMVWNPGAETPRRIASGGVIWPYLSPDGTHIVFTRGPQGVPETLWVTDVAGTAEQELVGRDGIRAFRGGKSLIGQLAWYDNSVLYFNSQRTTDTGVSANDDLYRANIRTREVALIFAPTEGGNFTISPNREHIIVVYPGTYGRQDGRIRVVDPLGQEDKNLLFFIGVSTASEYNFYPQVYWRPDNSAVRVAVPDPDLVYDEVNSEPAAVWNLPVDIPQERSVIGSVPASFFGLPQWSDSGQYMTYMQRVGDASSNRFEMVLADADGANASTYATGNAGSIQPPQWIPGTERFVYAQGEPGMYWLGEPGTEPRRIPGNSETVFTPLFIDDSVYVFATTPADGAVQLRYAQLTADSASSTLIAEVGESLPAFDAVLVSSAADK